MKQLDETFAEYLTEMRQELTYAACAQKLHIAESTLYRLINHQQSATLAMVDHIVRQVGQRASLAFDNERCSGPQAPPKRILKMNQPTARGTLASASPSVVQRISEIRRKADAEIATLRQEAVSEIFRRLFEVKQEIQTLEEEYAQLTGKPFPDESSGSGVNGAKPTRKRLSTDEKAALVEKVRGVLVANPNGIAMGELILNPGEPVGAVMEPLLKVQKKTTRQRARMMNF